MAVGRVDNGVWQETLSQLVTLKFIPKEEGIRCSTRVRWGEVFQVREKMCKNSKTLKSFVC